MSVIRHLMVSLSGILGHLGILVEQGACPRDPHWRLQPVDRGHGRRLGQGEDERHGQHRVSPKHPRNRGKFHRKRWTATVTPWTKLTGVKGNQPP